MAENPFAGARTHRLELPVLPEATPSALAAKWPFLAPFVLHEPGRGNISPEGIQASVEAYRRALLAHCFRPPEP